MKAARGRPRQLFIYGSLLTGTPYRRLNRAMARRLSRARPAWIRARRYELGTYPGAIPSADTKDRVHGRLLKLDHPALLRHLDRYEDYFPHRPAKSEFVRVATQAFRLGDRRPVSCWVYFYNVETDRHRVPGKWWRQGFGLRVAGCELRGWGRCLSPLLAKEGWLPKGGVV